MKRLGAITKLQNEILFGIQVQDKWGSWVNMCNGSRALIFSDKKLANAVCRAFKIK